MLREKLLLPVLFAISLLTPGCIGTFALTHEVWERNMKVESKVGRELLFLGLVIVPVYEISLLADMLIFNTGELFSDENLWATQQPRTSSDIEP